MNRQNSLVLVFIFSVYLSFLNLAQAATIQVTPTSGGDCVNPTYNSCTLQQALTAAQTNTQDDTIHIAAGNYSISSNGDNPFSYAASNPESFSLTVIGDGVGATSLDGALVDQVMGVKTGGLTDDSTVHILIKGITFKRGKPSLANGGALSFDSNHAALTVEDCSFEDNNNSGGNNGGGANAFTDSGTIIFARNSFKNNKAANNGGGLSTFSDTGVVNIDSNVFENNGAGNNGGGVVVFDLTLTTTNITNNVFFNNNNSPNTGGAATLFLESGTVNFTNNTLDGNSAMTSGGGLKAFAKLDTVVVNVFNNIFQNNTANSLGSDLDVEDNGDANSTGAVVKASHNNLTAEILCAGICAANFIQVNITHLDPLFVDPANGDFHLLPTSSLIDLGDPAPPALPATDFEGDLRTIGLAPDLGADETSCGDGNVDVGAGEQCDDGNKVDGDCCNSTCQAEAQGASCDDGNTDTSNDACDGAGVCAGTPANPPSGGGGGGGCSLVQSKSGENILAGFLGLLALIAVFGLLKKAVKE